MRSVRQHFPAAACHLCDQRGIALAGRCAYGYARLDGVPVEHVEDTEDANTIAVFALRPSAIIRRLWAELADETLVLDGSRRGRELPVLDEECDVERGVRAVWPLEARP